MIYYIWLVPICPLLAFIVNGLLGRKYIKENAHLVSNTAIIVSFITSCIAFFAVWRGEVLDINLYSWIFVGRFQASIGFQVDALSAVMLMVVSTVATMVHFYSIGYMHGEEGYHRYYAYLSLFSFSMYMLVLANNYLMLYVFWESVGLCSYLLIGFWFHKFSATAAGTKAFLTNRVGDFGFGLGVMLLFACLGTLDYTQVFANVHLIPTTTITVITLLLFVGACGKSAQLPLFVWLPDAMEGPTPCSALIHAATMVTAGLYMIARSSVLFNAAPFTMMVVATVGALTAIFAASIGLVMNDIKKVLAYSTISQLGYMFLGLGVGAYTAGIFHLMTHAFFKALLFLGAGSVIHGMHGEQDMRKMGGLKKYMPHTWWTMLVACIAIAGIPPLSGFWSKDEILASAFKGGFYFQWALGCIAAFMTAFYMFRLVFMTFYKEERFDHHKIHPHESPPLMTVPLMILAVLSAIAGIVGISWPLENGFIHNFLGPVLDNIHHPQIAISLELGLMGFSVLLGVAGIFLAYLMYYKKAFDPAKLVNAFKPIHTLLYNKYYVDEIYNFLFIDGLVLGGGRFLWDFDAIILDGIVNGTREIVIFICYLCTLWDEYVLDGIVNGTREIVIFICHLCTRWDEYVLDGIVNGTREIVIFICYLSTLWDEYVVDGIVNGVADIIAYCGRHYRKLQTGLVQNYMFVMVLGMFLIIGAYFVII